MSLDEVKKELYISKGGVKKRKKKKSESQANRETREKPLAEQGKEGLKEVRDAGEKTEEFEDGGSKWVKRIAWSSVFIIILIVAGGVFFISRYAKTDRNVSIEMGETKEVYRGETFELDFNISNKSDAILKNASFSLNLPEGVVSLNFFGNSNSNLVSELIGDIGVGGIVKRTFKFAAVGENKSSQKINASITYLLGGSTFKAETKKEIFIKEPSIGINVKAPERFLSGSVFSFEIEYENNSGSDLSGVFFEAKYPSSFKFASSDIPPDSLNNRWELGEIKAGGKGALEISGSLEGADGSSFEMPFLVYGNFSGKDYLIAEETVKLNIAPSPININILVNRDSGYAAKIGEKLVYTIQYKNASGIALADVTIKAALSGELFDFETLKANAGFDSNLRTLTWNASNVPSLGLLEPNAGGEVNFEINLKPQFPIQRLNDKNFYLKVNAQIDSPSVPYYYLPVSKTKAVADLETKVGGLISVDAKAFFREPSAGISNAGVFPPKTGEETEYTIHWIIKNYATDASNVKISAFLKEGVLWTGVEKSNIDSVPLYNENTREIVWNIDKILATKGVISEPVEAVFQIRATPDSSVIGQYQPLLGETNLSANDNFTNSGLFSSDVALSTLLPDDLTVGDGGGRVIP